MDFAVLLKQFKKKVLSPRVLVSGFTLLALGLIVYLSRHELVKAWHLLGQANLWLLFLLVPFQIIVYYAGGEMIFSYLRKKKLIGHISRFEQTRIALELNLVNHILPSGGVSGISYTTWRLHKLGVSSAKSMFAQVIRYVVGFLSIVALLIVSVLLLALDGQINRYIVASSFLLVLAISGLTTLVVYMFSSKKRMQKTAYNIRRFTNKLVEKLTFGRRKRLLTGSRVENFFFDMHEDFEELSTDWRLLIGPFIWGLVYASFDVAMFMVAFWALGQTVNPAVLMVGYGVAGLASMVALTPGGAGVYEIVMIFFLTMAGVAPGAAIAGIVLTRVILLAGTIIFGYIFYQHAIIKYGKKTDSEV